MKGKEIFKKIPELCVPAGNFNTLKYALEYGADAVYVGGKDYSLRNFGDNFTFEELSQAVDYTHARNKKIYLTLNAIVSEKELENLEGFLQNIKYINFDSIIVSDFGVLQMLKQLFPHCNIHISTQTSTSNHKAVDFWAEAGVKRVNLARELTFEEVKSICLSARTEIEVFVHGALCISYSGRCMLSKYMAGRDANRGECSHTCRWKYYLVEEKRPDLYLPVNQDKNGTYIYNSRDLCLLEKLDLIAGAGVSAVKIEGRMKTENYVSLATWVYRQALDLIKVNKFTEKKKEYLMKELDKATHRNFTQGFMFSTGKEDQSLSDNESVGYLRKYRFAGSIENLPKKNNEVIIKARNQIKTGDILDILQPGEKPRIFKVGKMLDAKTGMELSVANTNDSIIICSLGKVSKYALLKVRV